MPVIEWIKRNKLTTFLFIVVVVLLGTQQRVISPITLQNATRSYSMTGSAKMPVAGGGYSESMVASDMMAPVAATQARVVIQDTSASLLVKDVAKARDAIIEKAKNYGGFMVSADTSNPGESPSGTVVVRVSADKLPQMLADLKAMAIKVVSESVRGTDVTDQYVDIEKRIALLEKTLAKFTAILADAKEISDITNLNREIITIQDQIDSYKGSKESLEKNAALSRVTVYLSTDEIALPYAPDTQWRPDVIFKLAVRSLVETFRTIGEKAIWIGVYAAIWVPLAGIIWIIRRVMHRKKK